MLQQFDSLMQLMETFADEQTAIDHLTAIRWRGGAFCPYCNGRRIYHFSDKRAHKCGDCRQRFSIKVGTIFMDTKIPLRKWFAAIWLITSHKKGIASAQLARDIKVTQKTAWFMLHRLREAAAADGRDRSGRDPCGWEGEKLVARPEGGSGEAGRPEQAHPVRHAEAGRRAARHEGARRAADYPVA